MFTSLGQNMTGKLLCVFVVCKTQKVYLLSGELTVCSMTILASLILQVANAQNFLKCVPYELGLKSVLPSLYFVSFQFIVNRM